MAKSGTKESLHRVVAAEEEGLREVVDTEPQVRLDVVGSDAVVTVSASLLEEPTTANHPPVVEMCTDPSVVAMQSWLTQRFQMTLAQPEGVVVFSPCQETRAEVVDLDDSSGEAHGLVVGNEAGEVASAGQAPGDGTPSVAKEVPSQ